MLPFVSPGALLAKALKKGLVMEDKLFAPAFSDSELLPDTPESKDGMTGLVPNGALELEKDEPKAEL